MDFLQFVEILNVVETSDILEVLKILKDETEQSEFSGKIQDMHLNTGGIAHGGYLATIADAGMGTAAHMIASGKRCVTINLEIKFLSAGKLGDNLTGKVQILKKTNQSYFYMDYWDHHVILEQ